jgi:carboxyl-terminal processing protease
MVDHCMSNEHKLTLWSFRVPRRGYIWALILALTLAAGALMDRWLLLGGIPKDARANFRLMAEAWNIIDRVYVDRGALQSSNLAYGAISGMTEALGDTGHSVFLSKSMLKKAGSAVQGTLSGVGLEIQSKDHQAVVVAPIDGSPAQLQGVRPGDIILEVDGHPVGGMAMRQISERIAGHAGEAVKLLLLTPRTGQKREVTIVRKDIKLKNVSWRRLAGTDIAHIRIAMFSDGVGEDLRRALREIRQDGLRQIILDVRNNPGGVLDEAVVVASQFLKDGNVLWERNGRGEIVSIPVQSGGLAVDMPLMTLVNGGTGSASEIVAAALHDAGRGKLVGETTFGTGTVLQQFQLSDGSALLLAVQEWLTPSKRSFWHKGIEPDVRVPLPPDTYPLLPSAEKGITAEQINASGDTQLLRAMALLNDAGEETRNGFVR